MKTVLIGGPQRSGTTLVQTLLANALNSPVLPEAHILYDIFAAYKRAKDVRTKTSFFYSSDDELLGLFRSFAVRFVTDVMHRLEPDSALVLKDPNFIQVLVEANAIFPEAVKILCVRDPRDIVASFLRIGQRQESKSSKYARREVRKISEKVLSAYAPLLNPGEPDATVVRYEEIVCQPLERLQALSREAGLQFSYDRLESPTWVRVDARHDPAWVTELEGQEPSSASIGSFNTVMNASEIETVQEVCKPIMERFGYPEIVRSAS